MSTLFRHILWGYELTYPDHWIHQQVQDADAFAPDGSFKDLHRTSGVAAMLDALEPTDAGPDAGQLLVRGEWNWQRQPIEPLWNHHIGMLAGMMGAQQVGSAPWKLGEAVGIEAEIVLPKKDNQRLWTGILMRDFRVLHFLATHPKEVRDQFEPAATQIISSLQFPNHMPGITVSPEGVPLPPGYEPVEPTSILVDLSDSQNWRAYAGTSGIGALQAFYTREAPIHNWEMEEYVPFPAPSDLGFARLQLRTGDLKITLGMMPYDPSGTITASSPANVVLKLA